ncbi:MAG: class I SAM-dependent methyltransferase [Methylibium sp.]
MLDVSCGTVWFTRRAESMAARVVGLDVDAAALDFARDRGETRVDYLQGDATALPFPDTSFDKVMSIAALCFIPEWPRAITEIVRVSRERFAIGLLNRRSALYLSKGRDGGTGPYAGARWHTAAEVKAVLRYLPVASAEVSYGVFDASASPTAHLLERMLPASLALGNFLLASGRRLPRSVV